jgi:hypothetical protein
MHEMHGLLSRTDTRAVVPGTTAGAPASIDNSRQAVASTATSQQSPVVSVPRARRTGWEVYDQGTAAIDTPVAAKYTAREAEREQAELLGRHRCAAFRPPGRPPSPLPCPLPSSFLSQLPLTSLP